MRVGYLRPILICIAAAEVIAVSDTAIAEESDMNGYLLRAEKLLLKDCSNCGYDINALYCHDLPFDGGTLSAGLKRPKSMCVAAMIELIAHAFQLHYEDHHNETIFAFLGRDSWERLRPIDIKSHIWVDSKLDCSGTGDAITAFGMGKRLHFPELRAGDFINLNRPRFPGHLKHPSGHAVLFLSYVDDNGKDIPAPDKAAGFRYFSSQGSTNGVAEKIAFFLKENNTKWYCPSVPGASTDCGVMLSDDQRDFNAGRLFTPDKWNAKIRDDYLASVKRKMYQQTKSKGPSYLGLSPDMSETEFNAALANLPDVMTLGSTYRWSDF